MKKLALVLAAGTMLIAPLAQAASLDVSRTRSVEVSGPHGRHVDRTVTVQKKVVKRGKVVRGHWARGERVPAAERSRIVRDYHRHGLNRPARGQTWIRVGNDYLLIATANGIIARIVTVR